jgi:hypothetical protein
MRKGMGGSTKSAGRNTKKDNDHYNVDDLFKISMRDGNENYSNALTYPIQRQIREQKRGKLRMRAPAGTQ